MKSSIPFQLEKFKIPPRYSSITWEKMVEISSEDLKFAKEYVQRYPQQPRPSLFLTNTISGTGKTAYAILLTQDLIKSGKLQAPPLFVSYRILMESLRQDRDVSFLQHPLFLRIARSSFTIFDDIGVELPTTSVIDRYQLVMERLWNYDRHCIFTSKFTINQFLNRGASLAEKQLLESIGSRFSGMCQEHILSNVVDFRDDNGRV